MDFKSAKRMELFSQYAVAAAKEAFEDAGLHMEDEDPVPRRNDRRFGDRKSADVQKGNMGKYWSADHRESIR